MNRKDLTLQHCKDFLPVGIPAISNLNKPFQRPQSIWLTDQKIKLSKHRIVFRLLQSKTSRSSLLFTAIFTRTFYDSFQCRNRWQLFPLSIL